MAQPQEYSPTAVQPYEPAAAPPTPAPAASPLQDSPGFQFQGHGNISHGGAIAGMFDNVLKGFVNGHAMGEAHKALQLKKKSDDLNASYNADAQRLYQMHASGVDPKTPEYQAAKSAVDGSWGALQDFRGGLIDQQGGKKKSSKGAKTGQDDPLMALTNPAASPQEKAQALYMISKKLGPPVYGQIATLNTPAAQKARATQNAQADVDAQHTTNAMTHEQAQATYNKYAGKTDEEMAALPKAEQDAFRNAKALITPVPKESGTTRLYASPDGKMTKWIVPGQEPPDWNAVKSGSTGGPKVGTFGDFMTAAYGEKPSPDDYVKGRALWAKSGSGTTVGEHVVMVPQKDGSTLPVTVQTTSTKSFSSAGNAPTTRKDEAPINPPTVVTPSLHGKTIPGLVEKGNVDVANRPNIDNGDGTHSSTFSMSFGTDKGEVLVPGVGDGTTYPQRQLRVLYTLPDGSKKWEVPGNQPKTWKEPEKPTAENNEALSQFQKTGKNLGTFKDEKAANAYAQKLHEDQAKHGKAPVPPNTTRREKPPRASAGVVAVGQVVGGRATPTQTKADEDVTAAVKLNSLAAQALQAREPGMQRQLALALIKAMAGRVNMQEYSIYTKNYGFANTIGGMKQMIESGKMPQAVVNQLARDAHANLIAAREAQKTAYAPNPAMQAASGSPSSGTSKGIVSVSDAMGLPKYKGKSRKEVSDAITAQGYTPQ